MDSRCAECPRVRHSQVHRYLDHEVGIELKHDAADVCDIAHLVILVARSGLNCQGTDRVLALAVPGPCGAAMVSMEVHQDGFPFVRFVNCMGANEMSRDFARGLQPTGFSPKNVLNSK